MVGDVVGYLSINTGGGEGGAGGDRRPRQRVVIYLRNPTTACPPSLSPSPDDRCSMEEKDEEEGFSWSLTLLAAVGVAALLGLYVLVMTACK